MKRVRPKLLKVVPDKLDKRHWWMWGITEDEDALDSIKAGLRLFRKRFKTLPRFLVLVKKDATGCGKMLCWHECLVAGGRNANSQTSRQEQTREHTSDRVRRRRKRRRRV